MTLPARSTDPTAAERRRRRRDREARGVNVEGVEFEPATIADLVVLGLVAEEDLEFRDSRASVLGEAVERLVKNYKKMRHA